MTVHLVFMQCRMLCQEASLSVTYIRFCVKLELPFPLSCLGMIQ